MECVRAGGRCRYGPAFVVLAEASSDQLPCFVSPAADTQLSFNASCKHNVIVSV